MGFAEMWGGYLGIQGCEAGVGRARAEQLRLKSCRDVVGRIQRRRGKESANVWPEGREGFKQASGALERH